MSYFYLFLSVIGLSFGQILFKKSALILNTLKNPLLLVLEPMFLGALTIYGLTTLCWVGALQTMPLGRAYLFMSFGYILVPLLSFYFLNEPLNPKFFLGSLLIAIGVIVSYRS